MMLKIHKLPEAEQAAGFVLQNSLRSLKIYSEHFLAALQLFDFSHQQYRLAKEGNIAPSEEISKTLQRWISMSGRDAVMTLYHFGRAMEGIRESMNDTPTIMRMTKHHHLRQANKLFRQHFPDFESMRHSVAHSAENFKNREAFEENSFTGTIDSGFVKGTVKNMVISDSFFGREYTTTHEGMVLRLELSSASLERLNAVKAEFYSGFDFS